MNVLCSTTVYLQCTRIFHCVFTISLQMCTLLLVGCISVWVLLILGWLGRVLFFVHCLCLINTECASSKWISVSKEKVPLFCLSCHNSSPHLPQLVCCDPHPNWMKSSICYAVGGQPSLKNSWLICKGYSLVLICTGPAVASSCDFNLCCVWFTPTDAWWWTIPNPNCYRIPCLPLFWRRSLKGSCSYI